MAVVAIAEAAGERILDIYNSPDAGDFQSKADDSPLTKADQASNDYIVAELRRLTPAIPIISEEEKEIPYAERKDWEMCWEVDPLDGTKEFIKRNGEFAVCIALLQGGEAVAGVVHAPAVGITAWAERGKGAFLKENVGDHAKSGEETRKLESVSPTEGEAISIVASRSHMSDSVQEYVDQFRDPEIRSAGSALKFLLIAKGDAHLYPRLAPTMEWDVSAGQIILEEAGGEVLVAETGLPMRFNREQLRNPHFIAYGKGVRENLATWKN